MLVILTLSLACTLPVSARADVFAPHETRTEDLAGIALIGTNLALAAQIGRQLQADLPVKSWGWAGVGVGVASIALGATETINLSGGVAVAGALAAALGVMQLTSRGDAAEPQGSPGALSHTLSFCPLVTSSDASGHGIGILTRREF